MFNIFAFFVFLYSVVLHEVSHGLMAESLGDNTARQMGRITLNPFKHLDLFGSVVLPLILYFSRAGFIFGYAKPVPYNPANLNDRRYGPAKVGFAGPMANLLLAVLAGLTLRFLPDALASQFILQLLQLVVQINLVLALFNLFPIPPLDGHWLLMAVLPAGWTGLKVFLYRYSLLFLFTFMFFIFPILFPVVGFLFYLLTGYSLPQ